jgi:serine/threonine protein kinase
VPLGGYFAGLATLQGIVILAVRFRALTEPRSLGPYRIERRLGTGGMADVFLAHRTGSGALGGVVQQVALKRLRAGAGADAEARLIEEARVLTRLSHPNIVRMLDAGVEGGEVYLALELVDGSTVARLLDRAARSGRPLGPAVAIEVGAQVAAALGHAHPAGLIHRDVTPQNVLVDADGAAKLTDFGIARALDRDRTRTGNVRGKLPYVAPEQLRGLPYDHRVDLHALGVLLHVIATGAPPFEGDSDGELLLRIMAGERRGADALAPIAGAPLAALIERMLATDPAARPADAAEVASALAPLRDETAGRAELRRLVVADRAAQDDAPAARRATRRLSDPSTPG